MGLNESLVRGAAACEARFHTFGKAGWDLSGLRFVLFKQPPVSTRRQGNKGRGRCAENLMLIQGLFYAVPRGLFFPLWGTRSSVISRARMLLSEEPHGNIRVEYLESTGQSQRFLKREHGNSPFFWSVYIR